jgi:hypothetical protein
MCRSGRAGLGLSSAGAVACVHTEPQQHAPDRASQETRFTYAIYSANLKLPTCTTLSTLSNGTQGPGAPGGPGRPSDCKAVRTAPSPPGPAPGGCAGQAAAQWPVVYRAPGRSPGRAFESPWHRCQAGLRPPGRCLQLVQSSSGSAAVGARAGPPGGA